MNDDIPIGKLVENDYNPRKRFDSAKMKELAGSIESQGIVQAITVRPLENGKYEVVAGMRRFIAAKNVGLKKIPAMIRKLSDEEAKLLSITENLERADLTPIEQARSFSDYLSWDEQYHFEDGQQKGIRALVHGMAEKLPISVKTIYNRLSLLHLPEFLQTRVDQGTLPIKWAEVIIRLKSLWSIRTIGMTQEEITANQDEIKTGIHDKMEEIASTIKKTEDGAFIPSLTEIRKRINQNIETEKMNLDQREKLASKLKDELEAAQKKLISFYGEITEYPSNWGELEQDDKLEWVKLHIEEQINKLTDERLDKISKNRALKSSQLDRYLMNLKYVKDLTLNTCPHCGAGIKIDYLERKIQEYQDEITALSEDEVKAGGELKDWRARRNKFEKLRREFTSKRNSYDASIKRDNK